MKPQKEISSPTTHRRRFSSFFSRFIPLQRLARDLFVLSIKLTLSMLAASIRLIVPPSKKSLLGETVLITGAGHGIGRELALQLSGHGCIVVCWDTDVEANRATMAVISEAGGEVHGFVVDVSQRLEVREAIRLMRKAGIPEISILINNAAVLMHMPLLEHEDEDIRRTFDVNVLAQFWTIQAILPSMLQKNKGHIVCISSMCGFYGTSCKVPYSSSKFAVRGLMEGLAEELRITMKNTNIKLTTVYPFYVDTGLARDPKCRFLYLLGSVSPKYAAKEVIRAIQRNYEECTIPRSLIYLDIVNRILPKASVRLITDFLRNARR